MLQGPDFVWHLDRYDKLKPYGFVIHGCIDGYVSYFGNDYCDYIVYIIQVFPQNYLVRGANYKQ